MGRKSTTYLTIELDEQIMHLLHSQAQGNATSIDEMVQAAIVAYVRNLSILPEIDNPAEQRRVRIRQEAAAWRSIPAEERRLYGGTFVAVHGGKVIDNDKDRLALLQRVRRQYNNAPILITPAAADTPREFTRFGLRRS